MWESLSHAPVLSEAPAPGEYFSPAPAVLRVGGLQGSVPGQSSSSRRGDEEAVMPVITLFLRKDGKVRQKVKTPSSRRTAAAWVFSHRGVRFYCDVLLSPDDSLEQLGLQDGSILDVDEQCEEDEEEVEDEDMDEIHGTESRFPAGFLPMRMCRWFPSGNCRQGWGCTSLTR